MARARSLLLIAIVSIAGIAAQARFIAAQGIEPSALPGLVADDNAAKLEGSWQTSTSVAPFVGSAYRYSNAADASATFTLEVPEAMFGELHVLVSHTPHGNRTAKATVTIASADGEHTVYVDQKRKPEGPFNFHSVGVFAFEEQAKIVIAPGDGKGALIADGVLLATNDQLAKLKEIAAKMPATVLAKAADPAEKKEEPKLEPLPEFKKLPPTRVVETITAADIDAALDEYLGDAAEAPQMTDQQFLVRATFDLLGRQPNTEELAAFESDASPDKRAKAIERMLASEDYGRNWANYWSDVMAYRQQEPELTFHSYEPFKEWLAAELNTDKTWDEVVFKMLTARGFVGEHPEASFIAFHQADELKLAGETSRVFLSIQIACAECHDHPFVDMPQETFHGMAAFFVRADAKIPWNDSSKIELVSKDKGEHKLPGTKDEMKPTALAGDSIDLGQSDLARRADLARWIVAGDNPYFARSYANRIWGRLMGRGFFEPVDDMGESAFPVLSELHNALTDHFLASGYDTKSVVRVVMNSKAYQRQLLPEQVEKPFAKPAPKQLRGDEVFDALVTAIGLPNVKPEPVKATGAFRFPPPPKSTRDLVNAAFGYDPSFEESRIVRTMAQAMFMMNNEQLQQQIDAAPESETYLSKLLAEQQDDGKAVVSLFRAVLARDPSDKEREIAAKHLAGINDRGDAYEDLLWSLINSAEFTTRR